MNEDVRVENGCISVILSPEEVQRAREYATTGIWLGDGSYIIPVEPMTEIEAIKYMARLKYEATKGRPQS